MSYIQVPEQHLLDRFTRLDDLLELQLYQLKRLGDAIDGAIRAAGHYPTARPDRDDFLGPRATKYAYDMVERAMDSAGDDIEVSIDGDYITAATTGTLEGVYVRLNSQTAPRVPLASFNPFFSPIGFTHLYLTWPAQAGKTLYLHIGRDAGAGAGMQRIETTLTQSINTVRTDKDTHFTGALATGAKEDEDITGLIGNRIRIVGVAIQADQALDFYLMFWSGDIFDDADLDSDKFTGIIQLDLSTYGKQVGGAGQYYMSLEGCDLDYQDGDATHELHMSLYNADGTAKNAGATGEVVVEIKYELRA